MNVLFITIDNVFSFKTRSIYLDLANQFIREGHYVTLISVCEKRDRRPEMPKKIESEGAEIFKVFSPNITRVSNYAMKGMSLIWLGYLYKKAVKQAMKGRTYSLVLYGSPPITVYKAIETVKKKHGAYSYLLLKDIWPYDSVFGGVLSTKGWKGIAFSILKRMARRLYRTSDTIGCMSPANVRFLTENEPMLNKAKIEVNPNSIKPFGRKLSDEEKNELRAKYGIPENKVICIYGGNLGLAQGVDFALEAVRESNNISEVCFVFAGGGTAKQYVEKAQKSQDYKNLIFISSLPKDEYDQLVYACDIGLIFLNHECLAPNYPSRLLSYLQAGIPVLCATDTYTDIGRIAEENGYGLWCESNNTKEFKNKLLQMLDTDKRKRMGLNAKLFLDTHYTVDFSYNLIMSKVNCKKGHNNG